MTQNILAKHAETELAFHLCRVRPPAHRAQSSLLARNRARRKPRVLSQHLVGKRC